MIDEFSAKNYGCLRDVTVRLTPLHAFIGPNDSGKSTLLRAIRLCAAFGGRRDVLSRLPIARDGLFDGSLSPATELGVRRGTGGYFVRAIEPGIIEESDPRGGMKRTSAASSLLAAHDEPHKELLRSLTSTRVIRLDPDQLRTVTPLLAEGDRLDFRDDTGHGLASVIDAIRDRNDDAWRALHESAKRMFPSIARLQLQVRELPGTSGGTGKTLAVELKDGTRVPVEHLSEGFLYYLAFAVLRHLDSVSILCVEEPENGLHPARIREVVNVLRDLSQRGTQVLLTTHSPLVVNELRADEVTVLTRPEGGTRATRLNEVPYFRERIEKDRLLPGEFWVSYCDGELESLLLEPQPDDA